MLKTVAADVPLGVREALLEFCEATPLQRGMPKDEMIHRRSLG